MTDCGTVEPGALYDIDTIAGVMFARVLGLGVTDSGDLEVVVEYENPNVHERHTMLYEDLDTMLDRGMASRLNTTDEAMAWCDR